MGCPNGNLVRQDWQSQDTSQERLSQDKSSQDRSSQDRSSYGRAQNCFGIKTFLDPTLFGPKIFFDSKCT